MRKSFKSPMVERILAVHERARNDDRYLYMRVLDNCGIHLTVEQQAIFLSKKTPSAETVTRTRRKLQENGQYKANPRVEEARKDLEVEVRRTISQSQKLWPWRSSK